MNVPVALTPPDQLLNPKSTGEEIRAALTFIAKTGSEPIALEQQLRAVATHTKTSLKAVRQNYDMVLKNLNLKPVDIGLSIARDFLDKKHETGIRLRFANDGFFFAYSGTCWLRVSEGKIRSDLQEIAVEYKQLTDKTLHSLVSDALGSLKDYLGSNQDILSWTEEPPAVINFLNGELWLLPDGNTELRPHKPESNLMYCLPFAYDPAAECPIFDQALLEIFAEAKEPEQMRRHIYEFLGYAIQPRRAIPCFWLFIGHGANGKSTLLQTVCNLISSDYLYNVDMSSFGRDKFSMSQLAGKLVMIDDDLKIDTVIADGLLKKISESKSISARQPYGKQSFTFLNTALPIMAGNSYPLCNDLSQGLLRRAMIVPFRRQFQPHEQDKAKFEYIWAQEMPGVINRAIEGYQRVVKRKHFDPPQECLDARHDFLAHGNPLYCFLTECLVKKSESRIPFPQLRTSYEAWAKEQNISRLSDMNKTLKRKLQALGFEIGTYNGYSCVLGYDFKSPDA